jgi:hypothetical protein
MISKATTGKKAGSVSDAIYPRKDVGVVVA